MIFAKKAIGLLSLVVAIPGIPPSTAASGHGPVFGLATPTNAKGGWSLDGAIMGRTGEGDSGTMFRGMVSYGVTEDVQVSISAPIVFSRALLAPARMTGMMPGTGDFEGIFAWRFHRQGTAIGRRLESTAYGGVIVPGPQRSAGLLGDLRKASGVYTAVATGLASRSHYLWGGVGNVWFDESEGDRRPDVVSYSVVWGYRPPAWQKDYPHWDWRFFAEMSGENSGRVRKAGVRISETGGHQIFLGPAMLGIFKNYAVEGGIQFPIFRDVGSKHAEERFRFACNLSYFF